MSFRLLNPGERLALDRGQALVSIPLYGAHDHFVRCFASLMEHTPTDVPILIADDAGPDPASRAWVEGLEADGGVKHEVLYVRHPENLGFLGNVNCIFSIAPAADIVVLNSDCVVAGGWLEGMRSAAYSDTLVATVSTLTNHGTIVSVPRRNAPGDALPQDVGFERAAGAVRERSLHLHPRVPTAIGHCMYIRRSALDLVGPFDDAFAPAYGEEVDFSQRCVARGLLHVVADDVLIYHHGRASLGKEGERNPIQDEHEEILHDRYPYYAAAVEETQETLFGRLPRALSAARRAMGKMSVTIDARCLGPFVTGTQIHTLELLHALWRTQQLDLRVIVAPDVGDYARETLAVMPGVEVLKLELEAPEDTPRTDVVHRPFQISAAFDIDLLRQLGERIAVTHQDLIAYRNPSYFSNGKEWLNYRRLARESLAVADHVLFFSAYAAQDAIAEDLLEPYRYSVVHIGVDHRLGSLQPAPAAPPKADELDAYLLCIGTDFHHKNRVFAMKLLAALWQRHGWPGNLVLAGPHVRHGSSAADEAAWRAQHRVESERVLEFPAVNEAEKAWLYEHATAVVYPTVSEGFGLIPFEAAAAGVPCLFAQQASLPEVLPEATATIVPWDADASADASIGSLTAPAERGRMIDEIRSHAATLTWEATAQGVIAAYERMLQAPSREAARMASDGLDTEAELFKSDEQYWALRNDIGPTGLSLVGTDGHLPEHSQRAIAALARRPMTRGPLLAGLRAAGRLGGAVTRRKPEW